MVLYQSGSVCCCPWSPFLWRISEVPSVCPNNCKKCKEQISIWSAKAENKVKPISRFTSTYPVNFLSISISTELHQKNVLSNRECCVLLSSLSLCLSTAQKPLSMLCLQAACSCWLASSCAQEEFLPTIPIMKIKTCGRGPNRYCKTALHCQTYTGVLTLPQGLQNNSNTLNRRFHWNKQS